MLNLLDGGMWLYCLPEDLGSMGMTLLTYMMA